MSKNHIEYGCGRCGTHIDALSTDPKPPHCIECGSTLLIRRMLGPNEVRRRIDVMCCEITKMWEEFEKMDKIQAAILDTMRSAATDIIIIQEKLDAFIKAHDEEPEEGIQH